MSSSRFGWQSDLPTFIETENREIEKSLRSFIDSPSQSQLDSWKNSIRWLNREYSNYISENTEAAKYSTILEYELPRDLRRPDVIVLQNGHVAVIEIKGQTGASQAARDQVSAYARDLQAYHRACEDKKVIPILVPSNGPYESRLVDGVWVVGPAGVHNLLTQLSKERTGPVIEVEQFLRDDAYAPLPTIVKAARHLFQNDPLPRIKRARAATEPAISAVTKIVREAAKSKTRHLILLSGVPGAGKTLVGLQIVHAGWLDELAVEREHGKPSLPAVYLSGNGPLVQVLQHALKEDGAGGKTFVQAIKNFVSFYTRKESAIPPEHLVIFDEAQRAHDAERVAQVHRTVVGESEPEHLINICNRIPEWNVLVALIGSGQAIHVGEEGGVGLWKEAIDSQVADTWTIHAASKFSRELSSSHCDVEYEDALDLDTEIRFHLTPKVHEYVESLLDEPLNNNAPDLADQLWDGGHRFLITRDLNAAREYLQDRYADAPEARYGILASSKDKDLERFGIDNTFQTTKRLKVGPWYNSPAYDELSCCQLQTVATEFSSQGLELDFVLLGWGSDLLWIGNEWSMAYSRGTRGYVANPLQIRKNVYRVLLTRGRDGTVIFLPDDSKFDSTFSHLVELGMRPLT